MTRVVVSNVQVLTAGTRYDQEQAQTDGKPIPTTVVTLLRHPGGRRADRARGRRRPDHADAAQPARHGADGDARACACAARCSAPAVRRRSTESRRRPRRVAPRACRRAAAAAASRRSTRSRRFAPPSAPRRQFVEHHDGASRLLARCASSRCAASSARRRCQQPRRCSAAADRRPQASGSAPRSRSIERVVADRRPLDGAHDRLRHHAHRGHQSGGRRRRGRAAARDPDRRQGAGHGQPDRLGRRRAQAVRRRRRSPASRRSSSSCRRCSPAKTSASTSTTRRSILSGQVSSNAVMLRAGEIATAASAEAQGHQPAAAAWRQREPAGDAAGAVRRSEPPRAHRARREPVRQPQRLRRPDRRRSSSPRRTSTTEAERAGVQRLPEPVLLRHASTASAACSRRCSRRGGFQSLAEPNLIAYNGQEASFLAGGEFPVPVVQGNAGTVTRACSRSSASG